MNRLSLAGAALLFAMSTGCYKSVVNNVSKDGSGGQETKIWTHGLLAGIIPLTKVDAGKTCGKSAVSKVESKASFVNMLVTGVTFMIHSPMTVTVTCKG